MPRLPRSRIKEPWAARSAVSQTDSQDPLVARVRTWIAERDAADALMREWQRLETALVAKHGGMTSDEAVRRGHSEGRAMQDLERRCDALDRRLDRDTMRIVKMRAKTAEGVIAKIELGLEIQSPFDRDECSWALIESGCRDLRMLIPECGRMSSRAKAMPGKGSESSVQKK